MQEEQGIQSLPLDTLKQVQKAKNIKLSVPALYDPQTGQKRNLSELEYEDINLLVSSGKLSLDPEAIVTYVDQEGKPYSGYGKHALENITNGFLIDTPTNKLLRKVEKEMGTSIEQAKTLLEGGAEMASLGLSRVMIEGLSESNAALARARRAVNPSAHLTGEILGVFTPLGLEALGARATASGAMKVAGKVAGYSPIAMVEKLGAKTASKASGLFSEGVSSSLLGRTIIRGGVAGGVEGAISNGSLELADQIVEKELNAEHLISSFGDGALLGAGVGTALVGGVGGVSAVGRKLSKLLKESDIGVVEAFGKLTSTDPDKIRAQFNYSKAGIRPEDLPNVEETLSPLRESIDKINDELTLGKISVEEARKNAKEAIDALLQKSKDNIASGQFDKKMVIDEMDRIVDSIEASARTKLGDSATKLSDWLDDSKNMAHEYSIIGDQWLSNKYIDSSHVVTSFNKFAKEAFNDVYDFELINRVVTKEQKALVQKMYDMEETIRRFTEKEGGRGINASDYKNWLVDQFWKDISTMRNAADRVGDTAAIAQSDRLKHLWGNMREVLDASLGKEYEKYVKPLREGVRASQAVKEALKARKLDPLSLYKKLSTIAKEDVPLFKDTILKAAEEFETHHIGRLTSELKIAKMTGNIPYAEELTDILKQAKKSSLSKDIDSALNSIKTRDEYFNELKNDVMSKTGKSYSDVDAEIDRNLKNKKQSEKVLRELKKNLANSTSQNTFVEIAKKNQVEYDAMVSKYKGLFNADGKIISSKEVFSIFNAAMKGDGSSVARLKNIVKGLRDNVPELYNMLNKVAMQMGYPSGLNVEEMVKMQQVKQHFDRGGRGVNNTVLAAVLGTVIGGTGTGILSAMVSKLVDSSGPQFARNMINHYSKMSALEKVSANGFGKISKSIDDFFGLQKGSRVYSVGQRVRLIATNEHSTRNKKMTIAEFNEIRDKVLRASVNEQPYSSSVKDTYNQFNDIDADGLMLEAIGLQSVKSLKFLEKVMPKQPRAEFDAIKKTKWTPSDAELYKFKRYYDAVQDPYSVFDNLNSGAISTEEVTTLKEVYPEMYAQSVGVIAENLMELADKPGLSYSKRLTLSQYLGKPMDESMESGFIIDMQALHAEQSQVQSNQQDVSRIGKSEAASRQMTGTQKTLTRA